MCIARRFNAGNHGKRESSPEGTAEDRCGTTVQPSLRDLARPTMIPALKRRAILIHPSGIPRHAFDDSADLSENEPHSN